MIRKIERFNYSTPFGRVYSLPDFFAQVEKRKITPQMGTISEVLIDGQVTNILIENWDMYQIDPDCEIMSLREFEKLDGLKEILWIAKK